MANSYDWSILNHLQVGRYAEYFVKMEFTRMGFDVYGAEVDDKGIDFVVRKDATTYYDVQVKSCRGLNYIFFSKSHFHLRANLLGAVVLFEEGLPPALYLIPALSWNVQNSLFVDRNYEGKQSAPEYGLNISRKNMPLLEHFALEKVVSRL